MGTIEEALSLKIEKAGIKMRRISKAKSIVQTYLKNAAFDISSPEAAVMEREDGTILVEELGNYRPATGVKKTETLKTLGMVNNQTKKEIHRQADVTAVSKEEAEKTRTEMNAMIMKDQFHLKDAKLDLNSIQVAEVKTIEVKEKAIRTRTANKIKKIENAVIPPRNDIGVKIGKMIKATETVVKIKIETTVVQVHLEEEIIVMVIRIAVEIME